MTEEEIEKAVGSLYLEFTDYMRKVEGFLSVPEMVNFKYWELWKSRKYKDQLKDEVHEAMQSVTG
jgi:hypothetical protein